MTKISVYLFAIFCCGMLFVSCQKEESEFIDETGNDGTITKSSVLTDLLLGASQNPGSSDNIIDGNSCSQVKYPATVIANGNELVLETKADLSLIQDIFDQSPNDTDTLKIIFPITLVLKDFSEVVINDQDDLDDLAEDCQGGTENACVDFVYPVTLFTYNTDQQQTGTVIIESDKELYLLFYGLEEEDLISIQFPISIILEDGTTTIANNNEELEDILELADCDESGEVELDDFVEDLTSGDWHITYYFNDLDETDSFSGYKFTFAAANTAQASKEATTVPGTWALSTNSTPKLDIFFGSNAPFNNLDVAWEIIEADSEIIRLRYVSENGGADYLTFERNPNTEGSNEELNALIENLTMGTWLVGLFEEGDTNKTSNYDGYVFTFFKNGSVSAVGQTNTVSGLWKFKAEGEEIGLELDFDSDSNENFEDLSDDWIVLESAQDKIQLGDGSDDSDAVLLTFEKR